MHGKCTLLLLLLYSCVWVPVFVYGVYALRVVSTDKILRFIYTFIIIESPSLERMSDTPSCTACLASA